MTQPRREPKRPRADRRFAVLHQVRQDWCWREASEFPSGDNNRIPAYKAELEGQPVTGAVGRFADLTYRLTMLETSEVLGEALQDSIIGASN